MHVTSPHRRHFSSRTSLLFTSLHCNLKQYHVNINLTALLLSNSLLSTSLLFTSLLFTSLLSTSLPITGTAISLLHVPSRTSLHFHFSFTISHSLVFVSLSFTSLLFTQVTSPHFCSLHFPSQSLSLHVHFASVHCNVDINITSLH